MSDAALGLIQKLALTAPVGRYLEIGVFYGVTTTLLAQLGEVVAVDWFRGNVEYGDGFSPTAQDTGRRRGGFYANLDRMGVRERVTVVEGNSRDVVPRLKGPFGLVIVDGDHSFGGALADIEHSWDKIAPGGWLVLDDYSEIHVDGQQVPTVREAWEHFMAERGLPVGLEGVSTDDPGAPKTVGIQKAWDEDLTAPSQETARPASGTTPHGPVALSPR